MNIRITAESIRNKKLRFVHKEDAMPGVKRAAGYVCKDLEAIFSVLPEDETAEFTLPEKSVPDL